MNEIELPCCGAIALFEDDATTVQCEACNLVLDLAPDVLEPAVRIAATLLAAA
jgi:hypothetical protein